MPNRAGVNLLIYVEDSEGSGTYSALGGQNSATVTLNTELIETTDKLGNEFVEYLEEHGIQSMSVSGAGLIDSSASEEVVRAASYNRKGVNCIIVFTDSGPLAGARVAARFMIPSYEVAGEHTDAQNYSITLESNGSVNYSN